MKKWLEIYRDIGSGQSDLNYIKLGACRRIGPQIPLADTNQGTPKIFVTFNYFANIKVD